MGREEVDLYRLRHESVLSQPRWPTPYSSPLLIRIQLYLSASLLARTVSFFLPFSLAEASHPLSNICMQNNLFVHMHLNIWVGEVAIIKKNHFVQQTPLAAVWHCMFD